MRSIESQEDYEETRSKTPEKSFEWNKCEELGDMVMNFDSPTMSWFQFTIILDIFSFFMDLI